jgi:hypothetical protein
MPTSFFGLFLFSTALSLIATFTAVGIKAVLRKLSRPDSDQPRLR